MVWYDQLRRCFKIVNSKHYRILAIQRTSFRKSCRSHNQDRVHRVTKHDLITLISKPGDREAPVSWSVAWIKDAASCCADPQPRGGSIALVSFSARVRDKCENQYYFHVNGSIGIVQKIDFEIRPDLGCTTPKTSRKVVLDNPSVCLSVCPSVSVLLSVLLSLFPRALTGVRFNRSSWNFRGMFGYMGHCAVPIFEAIREPVYKII